MCRGLFAVMPTVRGNLIRFGVILASSPIQFGAILPNRGIKHAQKPRTVAERLNPHGETGAYLFQPLTGKPFFRSGGCPDCPPVRKVHNKGRTILGIHPTGISTDFTVEVGIPVKPRRAAVFNDFNFHFGTANAVRNRYTIRPELVSTFVEEWTEFRVYVGTGRKEHRVGSFKTEREARAFRDSMEKKYARTRNFKGGNRKAA